jgi:aspartate-semialdehyde dehydrogenase
VRLAVVGATGAVGSEILRIVEQRNFPASELVPIASARSAGRKLSFQGGTTVVRELSADAFDGVDVALFDVPDDVAAEWAPTAVERGATVVDNSAAFRMDPDVPLVVPEVNPTACARRPKGIVASPNCTTLTIVVPLYALHRVADLQRVIVASYQAASGAGRQGIEELWDQTQLAAKESEAVTAGLARDVLEEGEAFAHPLAMNVIPQCGSVADDGYTSEEHKLCHEARRIMDLPDLPVTATCVRVPVVTGHSAAVHAEFDRALGEEEARSILERAAGVEVRDDASASEYPTPLEAAGRDPCYVGRIRQDRFDPRALEFFCTADNLRKGAALNTVQIAELLIEDHRRQ